MIKIKLTEYEEELIDSAFETFSEKSTEFIMSVATDEVSESLDIEYDDAFELILDYLSKRSINETK